VPDISQGSGATHLRCGGIFGNDFVTDLLLTHRAKKFVKTVEHLAKLWATVVWHLLTCRDQWMGFLRQLVYDSL